MLEFAGLVVAVAAVSLTFLQFKREAREKQEAEDHEVAMACALKAEREGQRERDDARLLLRDRQQALEIHAELTSREVQLAKIAAPTSPADRDFLKALFERSTARYAALTELVDLKTFLEDLIPRELDVIAQFDAAGNKEGIEVIASKRSDYTKYVWGDRAGLPKWETLNLVAQHVVEVGDVVSVEQMQEFFRAAAQAALAPEVFADFSPEKLLTRASEDAKGSARNGTFTLEGTEYFVSWAIGFPNRSVGLRVHKPLLENVFMRDDRFPISSAS